MTYELITARNLTGLEVPLIYVNDITGGLFMNLLLIGLYIIVTMGLYFSQKKAGGQGDFPMSVAIGGFITTIFIVLMRLIPGLVSDTTFWISLVVTIISVIWFLFSKE